MIWYDVRTKAPVAPGACEDDCPPSIESYECPACQNAVELEYKTYYEGQYQSSFGICAECGLPLLVAG